MPFACLWKGAGGGGGGSRGGVQKERALLPSQHKSHARTSTVSVPAQKSLSLSCVGGCFQLKASLQHAGKAHCGVWDAVGTTTPLVACICPLIAFSGLLFALGPAVTQSQRDESPGSRTIAHSGQSSINCVCAGMLAVHLFLPQPQPALTLLLGALYACTLGWLLRSKPWQRLGCNTAASHLCDSLQRVCERCLAAPQPHREQQCHPPQCSLVSMDATANILGEGPYVWNVIHDHVESTRPSGNHTRPVKLPLTVTVPMTTNPGSTAPPGPFPVCILLNGFQVGVVWGL